MTEQTIPAKRRAVAIVGRPNVGKSAIFNRLAGARIAIVHEESGVTRDRLMREVCWENERFDLVDTGGLCNVDKARTRDEIQAGIQAQVEAALDEAAVAILVVDIEASLHPLDEEVARMLRKNGCPTMVAANKADNEGRDASAADFERLGFPVFPVSALHDRGFDPLMTAVVGKLPETPNETMENPLKIAVVGRPNAGKSSFINRLLRADRMIVSSVPGTTRDSVDVPFTIGKGFHARHYLLIDTAGLRRGARVDSLVEKFSQMRTEKSIERADVVVVVIDATGYPSEQDKRIVGFVLEQGKGCIILVAKWDLANISQREYEKEARWVAPFACFCPIVFASSKTGYNVRRMVDAIDHVAAQTRIAIPTGLLNRVILDAYDKVRPPSVRNRRLNIYYATQVGVSPIRIRCFVNDPALAVDAYRAYLERVLRSRFGLDGAPIVFQFRHRSGKQR